MFNIAVGKIQKRSISLSKYIRKKVAKLWGELRNVSYRILHSAQRRTVFCTREMGGDMRSPTSEEEDCESEAYGNILTHGL